jgi:hypothetical protein
VPASRGVYFEYAESGLHPAYYSGGMKRTRSKLLRKVHDVGWGDAVIEEGGTIG